MQFLLTDLVLPVFFIKGSLEYVYYKLVEPPSSGDGTGAHHKFLQISSEGLSSLVPLCLIP